MSVFARVESWDQLPGLIARMQQAGAGHRIPLYRALMAGRIGHLEIQQGTSANHLKRWTAAIKLPGLLLIGDDGYAAKAGPNHWPLAERALRWCRGLIVHGGKGEPMHYESAVSFAEGVRRVLFVECASRDINAWHAAADRWSVADRLTFAPGHGQAHPVAMKPEAMQ